MGEEKIEAETESVLTSVDNSAEAGVPLEKVLEVIRKSINKDVSGRNIERICRALVYMASEGADPGAVVEFTGKLLDEEVDGQEVAFKIYIRFGRR
jgi:flagellar biosynthesis component FlhA